MGAMACGGTCCCDPVGESRTVIQRAWAPGTSFAGIGRHGHRGRGSGTRGTHSTHRGQGSSAMCRWFSRSKLIVCAGNAAMVLMSVTLSLGAARAEDKPTDEDTP